MTSGYTQANKKGEMAAKMVTKYAMNGKTTGYGGGMKYRGHGKNSGPDGGMKYTENGKDAKGGKGQKAHMAGDRHDFSSNYTQNGK